MRNSLVRICALLMVMTGLLAGCSKTNLVNSWHDEQYNGPPLTKVMVVAMLDKDINRRFFETSFVDKVIREGGNGVASFRYMENLAEFKDRPKLVAAVEKSGADALLIVSVKGVHEEDIHTQGYFSWQPMGYARGYHGYYSQAYTARYVPGRNLVNRVVQLESRVYAVEGEKLVWGGQTESFNPTSIKRAVNQLVDVIIDDMQDAGLI